MRGIQSLYQYFIPYRGKIAINILLTLIGTVFSLFSVSMVIPFLGILFNTQPMVTEAAPLTFSFESLQHNFNYFLSSMILENGEIFALLSVCVFVVILSFTKNFLLYMANFFMAAIRNHMVRDMTNAVFNKVIKLPMSYFTEERKGDVMTRMTNDVQQVEVFIIRSLNQIIQSPIAIIIYVYTLFFMNVKLTLIVLAILPVSAAIIGLIGKTLREKSKQAQGLMGNLLSIMEETLYGMRIIKAFTAEKNVRERFHNENNKYINLIIKIWRKNYMASPTSEFLGTVVLIVVMWIGGRMILSGSAEMTSQAFIGYLVIFSQIIAPAKALSTVYYNFQKGMASFHRIREILETDDSITEIAHPIQIDTFQESIQYKDISFRYTVNKPVIKNISISLKKGETIALVGPSGGGKSTLADLLPRYYDVNKGIITIDGKDIRHLKLDALRRLIGVVNQEPILFNDSIANNIAFGRDNKSRAEIEQAAKIANAHDFILQTENGYDTVIGDRGQKLSGGQRQRLSIARAIIANPPILILDEATSALDTESEALVQEALFNLMKNRTSIVIAHRLSTIKQADKIYVIKNGMVDEEGQYETLLAMGGTFQKLHDKQFS